MKTGQKLIRIVEGGLLFLGLLLIAVFSLAYIHRFVMVRAAMTEFTTQQNDATAQGSKADESDTDYTPAGSISRIQKTQRPLGSHRARLSEAALGKPGKVLAVLRISRLDVEVPVLEGTDELTLNRGVGRIAGTAYPGEDGNIGIAGHRDGFFRPLKDIAAGDLIQLVTTSGTDVYAVDRVRVTHPSDVSALQPRMKPSLTLVTCYPFYFVGHAPDRYIVEASLRQSDTQDGNHTNLLSQKGRRP